jgi:DNA-binding CsgD family transcriptional regulator
VSPPRRTTGDERLARTIAIIETEASALRSLADSVPTALIWVSPDGDLSGANRLAHELSTKLGVFTLLGGTLKWRRRQHGERIAGCIATALAGKPVAVLLAVRGKPCLIVSARVVGLPPAPMVPPERCIALQLVPFGEPGPLPVPVLQTLYGLTPSEARLAHSLAARRKLSEAAVDARLTLTTARSYLKRIFLKTGTSRQAQLVRLLWSKTGMLA